MSTFHSNIISIHGEKGKAWLDELPQLVYAISSRLDLGDLKEVTNLSYNYEGFTYNYEATCRVIVIRLTMTRCCGLQKN